jgi:hypothetical protein
LVDEPINQVSAYFEVFISKATILTSQATSFDLGQRQGRAILFRDKIYKELLTGEVTFSKVEKFLSWEEFTLQPRFATPQQTLEYVLAPADSKLPIDYSRLKLIKDLATCRDFLSAFRNMRTPQTEHNRKTQHCQRVFKEQRVKIAIIDNGADQMRSTISANIVRGMSFVRSSLEAKSVLPWYTPAHPHGTQMADLIRNVNPWCELFPLRVASLHKDVDLHAAVDVSASE